MTDHQACAALIDDLLDKLAAIRAIIERVEAGGSYNDIVGCIDIRRVLNDE